jgi:transcriptional regulator with XRE-family HTH domain
MSSPERRIFPERLRAERERRGLSQAELGEKTGLQPSAVSHFETGRREPSFDNLRALADALKVSTDYLMGRDATPSPAGPKAAQMFRNLEKHMQNMSDEDLKTFEDFAALLAKKNKGEKGDKGGG